MYEPTYVRVTGKGARFDHIVRLHMFFDGEGKALCGVKPFPDRWEELTPGSVGQACAGCVSKVQGRKVR